MQNQARERSMVIPCKAHDHPKNSVFYLKCRGKPWKDFEQKVTWSYLGLLSITLAAMERMDWKQAREEMGRMVRSLCSKAMG